VLAGGAVVVTNSGNQTARGTFTIRVLASTDGAASPNDVTVATVGGQRVNLAPGRSKSYKLKFTTFPTAPDGNYFLLAQVDADNAFAETNEGNNVGATAAPINIAAPFVDLSGSLAPPGSLRGGGKGTVSVLIRNTGNSAASGTAGVSLLLSADRNPDGSDTALAGVRPARLKLNPGQAKPFRFSGIVPPAPGTYFLIAVLDAGNALTERDEANNTLISDGQVTIL